MTLVVVYPYIMRHAIAMVQVLSNTVRRTVQLLSKFGKMFHISCEGWCSKAAWQLSKLLDLQCARPVTCLIVVWYFV